MPIPKVRPETFSQQLRRIPKPNLAEAGTVRFSFKYAQLPGTEPFCVSEVDVSYFHKLLERLTVISGMKTDDFVHRYEAELRNHRVDFGDPKVTVQGFTFMNSTLREEAEAGAFQFSVTRNEHGRIIGFIVGDLYHLVWCDHSHKTYG